MPPKHTVQGDMGPEACEVALCCVAGPTDKPSITSGMASSHMGWGEGGELPPRVRARVRRYIGIYIQSP